MSRARVGAARTASGRAALSLVEVIIGVTLLTVVLLSLMALSVTSNRQINESNDRALALTVAQLWIEENVVPCPFGALTTLHNNTFDVDGFTTAGAATGSGLATTRAVGRVTVTDLNNSAVFAPDERWNVPNGVARLVTVRIADPNTDQEFAVISIARTQ